MTAGAGDEPADIERQPSAPQPTEPEPERPLTPGEALAMLFLANADRGANHANDELIEALLQRAREIQAPGRRPASTPG